MQVAGDHMRSPCHPDPRASEAAEQTGMIEGGLVDIAADNGKSDAALPLQHCS